jgi:hypothetical protein
VNAETAGIPNEECVPATDHENRARIVAALSSAWSKKKVGVAGQAAIDGEVTRFLAGHGASLSFFAANSIAWVTVAPSAADLHLEIGLLRAWVIPSYGWEDSNHPFVVPGEGTGRLSNDLLTVSPAGYYRWHCAHGDYSRVANRLTRMRALLALRPEHLHEQVPSLLELRQQFRLALVTGARDAADAAIRGIDHYQLDTAVNTHLMRVRMLDNFGEYVAIVDDPAIERLLGLRLPHAIRTAIVRAFHAVHVAPSEVRSAEVAATAYAERMHAAVTGLLTLALPSDGPEIARSLAYRAWTTSAIAEAAALLSTADTFVAPLLHAVLDGHETHVEDNDQTQAFRDALGRGDLRAIQALAPLLLSTLTTSPAARASAADAVRDSLDVLPNPEVAAELVSTSESLAVRLVMPQSWVELLERLRAGDLTAAEKFLSLDHTERPGPEELPSAERAAAVTTLEEILTDPNARTVPSLQRLSDTALAAFVEDFVSEPGFPRPELELLYLQLMRLWVQERKGSTHTPDSHLLLTLATAVLTFTAEHEREAGDLLAEWWQARPVPHALPFLLEVVDVLTSTSASDEQAQYLWLEGVRLVARYSDRLTPSEYLLWRRQGQQLGFDRTTIDKSIPPLPARRVAEEIDPLQRLGVSKIAIVSLHHRAAEQAQALLSERTSAKVVIVGETTAGVATKSAQSADVILFVWAASKHAVFRAFDAVRERVVYVQGTGAGSIVLALERWAKIRLTDNVSAEAEFALERAPI